MVNGLRSIAVSQIVSNPIKYAIRNGVEMSVGSIRRCMFDGVSPRVGDADDFAMGTYVDS